MILRTTTRRETSSAMRSEARGFSMVEVLVALVVLAVGMLGVASLFAISLHSGASAINRMQAINLVQDMAERIKANRRATDSYAYSAAIASPPAPNCVGTGSLVCTPAQLAACDIWQWQQTIKQTFPNNTATGSITVTDGVSVTTPTIYAIQLSWAETNQSTNSSYALQLQLNPY